MTSVQNGPVQTTATQGAPGAPTPAQQPPGWMNFVPMLAIFLIFYVLFIRPQGKQMKEQRKMLEELKKGDRVLTEGGFYGTIAGFHGSDVDLKLNDSVKIKITRSSIRRLANPKTELVAPNGTAKKV